MPNPDWWVKFSKVLPPNAPTPSSGSFFPLDKKYSRYVQKYLTESEWRNVYRRKNKSTDGIVFPSVGVPNGGGCIGYRRIPGNRYHCGVDLAAKEGDIIRACESGTIIRIRHFYLGTYCLFLQCASGIINFGEIANESWVEFKLQEKSIVSAGDRIARVGRMKSSSMLHFEMYTVGLKGSWTNPSISGNQLWKQTDMFPPSYLLNPTSYLISLLGNNTPEKIRTKEVAETTECR